MNNNETNPLREEPKCTLSDSELIKKCQEWVSVLAKSGGKKWSLRVPVDFNHDPDMLFLELCKRLQSQSLPAEQPECPTCKDKNPEVCSNFIHVKSKQPSQQEGKTLEDVKQFVTNWMDSHEPGTFATNEHGQYIYSCGAVSLNLKVFFEELLEDYANQPSKEWISLDDRLPEKRADVIVWFEPRESAIMCLWNNVFLEEGATYWMPVPTPPQK